MLKPSAAAPVLFAFVLRRSGPPVAGIGLPAERGAGQLGCAVQAGPAAISWSAAGEEPSVPSGEDIVRVLERDGVAIARIPDRTTSHTGVRVPPGEHLYRLTLGTSSGETFVRECAVVVGEEKPGLRRTVRAQVVRLAWVVPGGVFALGFLVNRDGETVAILGGDARSYREEALPDEHTYVVSTNNRLGRLGDPAAEAPEFVIGECRVALGTRAKRPLSATGCTPR